MAARYRLFLATARDLVEVARQLGAPDGGPPWSFAGHLTAACLHAEVDDWAQALTEVRAAEAAAPAELRAGVAALAEEFRADIARQPGPPAAPGRVAVAGGATSFFLEPGALDLLRGELLPWLLEERPVGAPVRVWVPACASGAALYSLAIALLEALDGRPGGPRLQLFGTDVSQAAIAAARAAVYPEATLAAVSPERRRRFFDLVEGGARIARPVRDACVFARHDLLRDPPFARMDLVSCRDLLCDLEAPLRRRALQVAHYALAPGGYLALGAAEPAAPTGELFDAVGGEGVYRRRPGDSRVRLAPEEFLPVEGGRGAAVWPGEPGGRSAGRGVAHEADRVALARYAPPSVVVDEQLVIVQFRGAITPYLEHRADEARLDLLTLVRRELVEDLRAALARARRDRTPVRCVVSLRRARVAAAVAIDVVPLQGDGGPPRHFLVSFLEAPAPGARPRPADVGDEETEALRAELRDAIDEQRATSERLALALEEAASRTEELTCINEELLTARDELHATNEALTSSVEGLQKRVAELVGNHGDLEELLASVDLPIVVLAGDLTIQRFTRAAEPVMGLRAADVGRCLWDLRWPAEVPGLDECLRRVLASGAPEELPASGPAERRFSLWARPRLGQDGAIDGVVVVLFDVTARDRAEGALREALGHVGLALGAAGTGTWSRDLESDRLELDAVARCVRGWAPVGGERTFADHLARIDPADRDAVREAAAGRGDEPFRVEYRLVDGDGGERWIADDGRVVTEAGVRRVVGVTRDVTARRAAEEERLRRVAEVQETRRLEGLAVLAGGVAHDFNNLLTSIMGNVELVRGSIAPGTRQQERLEQVLAASTRAAELARQLLAYAGGGGRVIRPLDLTALTRDTIPLVAQPPGVTVRLELQERLPVILADASQVRQVLTSLLVNAAEAAAPGRPLGIVVRTREERLDEPLQAVDAGVALAPGRHVALEVEDDGVGMAEAVRRRIFEPFFSTKFTGRGLGLAAVHGILRAHRGAVRVRTGPGVGATFTVLFPAGASPTSP